MHLRLQLKKTKIRILLFFPSHFSLINFHRHWLLPIRWTHSRPGSVIIGDNSIHGRSAFRRTSAGQRDGGCTRRKARLHLLSLVWFIFIPLWRRCSRRHRKIVSTTFLSANPAPGAALSRTKMTAVICVWCFWDIAKFALKARFRVITQDAPTWPCRFSTTSERLP